MTSPDVDGYIDRSESWPDVLRALRPILLRSGLVEQIKWRSPCYTADGKNIVIVQEMKEFLALMFFKGSLLADPSNVLEEVGPDSHAARRMTFRSVDDVDRLEPAIETYLGAAIDVERAGIALEPRPELVLVEELRLRIDRDPAFKSAFESLTPGRQREYNLDISRAKRTETRSARVEKHAERILAGKGLRDR